MAAQVSSARKTDQQEGSEHSGHMSRSRPRPRIDQLLWLLGCGRFTPRHTPTAAILQPSRGCRAQGREHDPRCVSPAPIRPSAARDSTTRPVVGPGPSGLFTWAGMVPKARRDRCALDQRQWSARWGDGRGDGDRRTDSRKASRECGRSPGLDTEGEPARSLAGSGPASTSPRDDLQRASGQVQRWVGALPLLAAAARTRCGRSTSLFVGRAQGPRGWPGMGTQLDGCRVPGYVRPSLCPALPTRQQQQQQQQQASQLQLTGSVH